MCKEELVVIVYLAREPRLFNQIGCHAVLTFVCLEGSLSHNIHRSDVFSSLSCLISIFELHFCDLIGFFGSSISRSFRISVLLRPYLYFIRLDFKTAP